MLRFFLFITFIILATALQTRSLELFGVSLEFVFVSLIVATFWISVGEQITLTALATILLNWRPGFAPELIFFALFPIALAIARPLMPWRTGVALVVAVTVGIVGLYVIGVGGSVFTLHSFLWKDVIGSVVIAILLFRLLNSLYHPRARRGLGATLYALPR